MLFLIDLLTQSIALQTLVVYCCAILIVKSGWLVKPAPQLKKIPCDEELKK